MGALDGWLRHRFWACTALNMMLIALFFWPHGGLTWAVMARLGYTGVALPASSSLPSLLDWMTEWQAMMCYAAMLFAEAAFLDWLFFDGVILGIWER